MNTKQQLENQILKSNLPDEVKKELINELQSSKYSRIKVALDVLRVCGFCKDLYDFFDD